MRVELSAEEARDLTRVLNLSLEALTREIVRADDDEYRRSLSEEFERLDRLRQRLDNALESAQAYV